MCGIMTVQHSRTYRWTLSCLAAWLMFVVCVGRQGYASLPSVCVIKPAKQLLLLLQLICGTQVLLVLLILLQLLCQVEQGGSGLRLAVQPWLVQWGLC